jgi:hypothetical protein
LEAELSERQYFVYFLACGPYVKIGRSGPRSLKSRIQSLASMLPDEPTLLGVVHCPHPDRLLSEGGLHVRFAKCHHRNEWFRLTDEIRAFVEENREPIATWLIPPPAKVRAHIAQAQKTEAEWIAFHEQGL